jgi:predicted Na+-dependent transporter
VTATAGLGYWTEVGYASIGVALSVLMPFLAALAKKYWPNSSVTAWVDVWRTVVPYLILGCFSLVVGVLVAAAADFDTRALAVLAGFAWDKTLQVAKLASPS